ncbi:hypothetical protein JOF29_006625 [Kribbella aluminosa]|uniref:Serpin domain-containing protein n=1 Tax=Kribbella aluminosa TaxID=416017 RepID=A0ABS4UV71_9ACTN|nr:serpin family protein [Kribbella aluminosa]MBP2355515.1 hypothetical protein [Kribbella aluminosa]
MDAEQVGRLTARWIAALPGEESTVVSGLGVQPLLAILAELADEPAHTELAEAAGERYGGLLQAPELRMALGLWTRPWLELQPGVDRFLPPEVRGLLTDQDALDAWVVEHTDGLLQRMPIDLTLDVLVVLASALVLKTEWELPFNEHRWGVRRWLDRTDRDLDSLQVYEGAAGPLTVVTVRGTGEIDVRLVVGDGGRAAVLSAALALDGDGMSGTDVLAAERSAPGVELVESVRPSVVLSLPYFEIQAEHDLLQHKDVFGLTAASDNRRGHFPGLSPTPLAIDQARQAVMARFTATGFEAAAVTAVGMALSRGPLPEAKALRVQLDRPFGFVAVHRPTGVPVVAGWVNYS